MSSLYNIIEVDNIAGFVSTNNTSITPLAASSVFTGSSDDVTNQSSIVVTVFTDASSITNGCVLQFSSNGVNWDISYPFTITASQSKVIRLPAISSFFRVVYTNNSVPQTFFRLQTIYHPTKNTTDDSASIISKVLDYDTGGGVDNVPTFGILLPNAGGAVAGGTLSNPLRIDPIGITVQPINDNGSSLTIDNSTLSVIGGGTEATALRVTIASDSTGVLSIDDNGSSLTIDGSVTVFGSVGIVDQFNLTNSNPLAVALVDTNGDLITSFGSEIQYTEDDVSVLNPVGTQLISRRRDSLVSEVSSDGDVIAVNSTAKGELYVKHVDSLPITDNGSSITIDNPTLSVIGGGTESLALRVTIANDSTGLLSIDDNGGSLTIDNPTLSVIGGGTESSALRVTIANDSTGVLSIDDNGSSLTIDNSTLSVIGGGTEATALRVTIANDSTGVLSIDDNSSSLTIDNPTLSVIGGGTEATALRVTLATDSTGVISIDDGGNVITVDNTGIFTIQDSEKIIDNNPFSDGVTKILPVGFVFDEVGGTSLTENDLATPRIDDKRSLVSVIEDASVRGRRATVTASNALKVDNSAVVQPINDNGSSITIDNPTLSVIGGGTEATALRVTIANDSTGLVSIDTAQLPPSLISGRLDTNIGAWLGSTVPTVGQKVSANSIPVVIASDQSQITVLQKTSDNQEISVRDSASVNLSTNSGYLTAHIDPTAEIRLRRGNIYGGSDIDFSEYLKSADRELKISKTLLLGEFHNKYNVDTLFFETALVGSGTVTHDATQSAISLTVTGANGDHARLRTHEYYHYLPNLGLGCKTAVLHQNAGVSNQTRRWGLFDDNDGVFFELLGTSLRIVHRSSVSGSPVDTAIAQSSWNIDVMDGTGISEMLLDLSKCNLFEINIEYSGVGLTRFYINNYLVHTEPHINTLAATYFKNTQFPLQFEIVNTAPSTGANFKFINGSVYRQTGFSRPGHYFAAGNTTDKNIGATESPLLIIRPKTTFNSITNRMLIIPKITTVSTESTRASYRVIMNPSSITGAAFTSVNSNSGVEFDQAATAFTGGEVLFRGFMANTNDVQTLSLDTFFNQFKRNLKQSAFATSVDTLMITGMKETGGGTTPMQATLGWEEYR